MMNPTITNFNIINKENYYELKKLPFGTIINEKYFKDDGTFEFSRIGVIYAHRMGYRDGTSESLDKLFLKMRISTRVEVHVINKGDDYSCMK